MNLKQAQDWLSAVAGCFPELKAAAARAWVGELGALAPLGSWEAGITGAGFERVDLRFAGGADYAPWAEAAARILEFEPAPAFARAPAASPWLEARWDLRAGALESRALYGRPKAGGNSAEDAGAVLRPGRAPARASRRASRFEPRAFPEPAVARVLAEFSALAPAAAKVVERERPGAGRPVERRWSLRLARRLPWPAFQRCDLSASFTERSAQVALLTPAHAVRELAFEGESLWAYFEG